MDISSNKQVKFHIKSTWTWLRKGSLKRETESLQIAAQNNAIRTMSKQTRDNKIVDVDHLMTETK